ncbi:hypothetical protein BJY24_005866 [Nocardia transvalensis]|uniref:Uncharacterized protein n=1 Tax=Nocardia transvalensis TaxID=37333 RepID=A0A7W9UKX0_9NOCA|nr:hypothetical protein [Nocardia transvalensis]MBB5916954.1 hypothetical protein [Nocardia transvalensis]
MTHSELEPHGETREFTAPPSRPTWIVWIFLLLLVICTIQLLSRWLTAHFLDQVILGTALMLVCCGGLLWRFLRAGRLDWAAYRTPDTLRFDTYGLTIRYHGTDLRLPWSHIRRIDGRGTGTESARLRVWAVDTTLPKRFRGKDGAAVLMPFGENFPRPAVADAAAEFAPAGVRVHILDSLQ